MTPKSPAFIAILGVVVLKPLPAFLNFKTSEHRKLIESFFFLEAVTMAIDVCSEISTAGIISPRISFSHDLNQTRDSVSIEDCHRRLDSCLLDSDFNFCMGSSFVQELSSADKLFSNGKILPIEIKKNKKVKDRKSTRLNSSHSGESRMPSSA